MYAGSRLPRVINDSSYFSFSKTGAVGDFSHDLTGWYYTEQESEPAIASQAALPEGFITLQASPNPFNPTTVASFELRVPSHVRLNLYDTAGRLVGTQFDGWSEAGVHQVTINGSNLATGVYLLKLTAGGQTAVQKLVLLK
jgi:hypothetical protein